jgi:hypothetical protein
MIPCHNGSWPYREHGSMAPISFPGSHVYKAKALTVFPLFRAWRGPAVDLVCEPTVTLSRWQDQQLQA